MAAFAGGRGLEQVCGKAQQDIHREEHGGWESRQVNENGSVKSTV